MHIRVPLCSNNRKSIQRLAVCVASLVPLIMSGTASAAPEESSVRGVSSVAEASATIANPAAIRAAALGNYEPGFDRFSGLTVAPAAVIRRDCADDEDQQNCRLIILDLP